MRYAILALASLGLSVSVHAATPTFTSTATLTVTPSITQTFTNTSTATPSATRTMTPTYSSTPTASITPTLTTTPTLTKTATPRGFAGPQVELMQPNGTPWPTPGPGGNYAAPCSNTVRTGIAGSVTSPSGVQGSSMVYLTGNATLIENPSANTITARYFLSTSSVALVGETWTAMSLEPGARRTVENKSLRFLHIYAPTPNGSGPLTVENCY